MKTLEDLTMQTGMEVLEHLVLGAEIPVVDGLQAQGDLFIIPLSTAGDVVVNRDARWTEVPAEGVEVLRGAAGGNPHVLVADAGVCRWTTDVTDRARLALGVLRADRPVHLLHPEHGGSGIAAGEYVIRRQREQAETQRLVAD